MTRDPVLVKHTCVCACVRHDRPRLLCCPCICYIHTGITLVSRKAPETTPPSATQISACIQTPCKNRNRDHGCLASEMRTKAHTHTHTHKSLRLGAGFCNTRAAERLTTDSMLLKETCVCAPALTTESPLLPNDTHYNHNNTPSNPFRNTCVCVTTRNHDHEFLSAHGRLSVRNQNRIKATGSMTPDSLFLQHTCVCAH